MDEMKIESKFTTAIVSKVIENVMRRKFGYDIDVQLNAFRTTILDDKAHLHLDLDMELSKDELNKLIACIGL